MRAALFLYAGLLVGAVACKSNSDPTPAPTPDPFLGHWVTQSLRTVNYDASGKITSDQTQQLNTALNSQTLDITSSVITIKAVAMGKASTETGTYTRSGENLTIIPQSGNPGSETVYARNLTANSFTLEFDGPRKTGQAYYIQYEPQTR